MSEPNDDIQVDAPGVINLDHDHLFKFSSYKEDPHAGAVVTHKKADGSMCMGFITIAGSTWHKEFDGTTAAWNLISADPVNLTLTPSLSCRVCGDHGFITNGKWVPV